MKERLRIALITESHDAFTELASSVAAAQGFETTVLADVTALRFSLSIDASGAAVPPSPLPYDALWFSGLPAVAQNLSERDSEYAMLEYRAFMIGLARAFRGPVVNMPRDPQEGLIRQDRSLARRFANRHLHSPAYPSKESPGSRYVAFRVAEESMICRVDSEERLSVLRFSETPPALFNAWKITARLFDDFFLAVLFSVGGEGIVRCENISTHPEPHVLANLQTTLLHVICFQLHRTIQRIRKGVSPCNPSSSSVRAMTLPLSTSQERQRAGA